MFRSSWCVLLCLVDAWRWCNEGLLPSSGHWEELQHNVLQRKSHRYWFFCLTFFSTYYKPSLYQSCRWSNRIQLWSMRHILTVLACRNHYLILHQHTPLSSFCVSTPTTQTFISITDCEGKNTISCKGQKFIVTLQKTQGEEKNKTHHTLYPSLGMQVDAKCVIWQMWETFPPILSLTPRQVTQTGEDFKLSTLLIRMSVPSFCLSPCKSHLLPFPLFLLHTMFFAPLICCALLISERIQAPKKCCKCTYPMIKVHWTSYQ